MKLDVASLYSSGTVGGCDRLVGRSWLPDSGVHGAHKQSQHAERLETVCEKRLEEDKSPSQALFGSALLSLHHKKKTDLLQANRTACRGRTKAFSHHKDDKKNS